MPASNDASPRIAAGEILVIGGLAIVAITGGVIALRYLEILRQRIEVVEVTIPKAEPIPAQPSLEPVATQVVPQPGTGRDTSMALSPVAVRTRTLGKLAQWMNSEGITNSPSMAGILVGGPAGDRHLPGYIVDRSGVLSPDFAELFALNQAELASLQVTTTAIKNQMDRLVVENTKIEQVEPDSYVLTVSQVKDGALLRGQLDNAFKSALGEERYRTFALLNGEGGPRGMAARGSLFNAFGPEPQTITVSKQNGRYRYSSKGTNGGGSGMTTDRNHLRAMFGAAADQLPPGF